MIKNPHGRNLITKIMISEDMKIIRNLPEKKIDTSINLVLLFYNTPIAMQ